MKFIFFVALTGLSANAVRLNEPGDMIAAADNKDIPPFTTTAAVTAMGAGKSMLFEQFAKASSTGYPVRGEKNW